MDLKQYESGAAAGKPAAPANPSAGFPTGGDPSSGTPATVPGVYWFYQMAAELENMLTQAGITPDLTKLTQLFNASQRVAGAQFQTVSANKVLTIADAGLVAIDASGGNVTVTLPASNVLAGLPFEFVRTDTSANTVTVAAAVGETIGAAASVALQPGDVLNVRSTGAGIWWSQTGNASQRLAAADALNVHDVTALGQFPSSLAANGWKKYPDPNSPSGFFIEQWGATPAQSSSTASYTQSFPIAFPNVALQVIASDTGGGALPYGAGSVTPSSCIIYVGGNPTSGWAARWFAKGY